MQDFLLGAATAAHQVEGNNIHSDYWAMEHMEHNDFAEPSLDAVDHYRRYEEDIRLLASAGLNAYRFSIEWARIEPQEGVFCEEALAHYRDVLRCCRENGVTPIVTMLHFTSPKWLIERGGWESERSIEYFRRYCLYVAENLGDEMAYVCTINEANMGLQIAHIARRYVKQMIFGKRRGQKADTAQLGVNMKQMLANMTAGRAEKKAIFGVSSPQIFVSPRTEKGDILVMRAHEAARDAMKAACPHLKLGLTLSLHDIQTLPGGERAAAKLWDEEFRHYLPYIRNDDFLGVQNYTRSVVGRRGVQADPKGAELTQMDYEFYPEALAHVIRSVHADFAGDILVTESGIATADDSRRVEFIRRAMAGVRGCIADGIPVIGYCYWSLLDNFEYQKGFAMTFGLIAVDRATQTRYPKESLSFLGSFR